MSTLKHPRIPNVTVDAPESDVARWVAQGWVSDKPLADEAEPTDEPVEPARPAGKRRK